MIPSKIKNYLIGALILALIGFYFFNKESLKSKQSEIRDLKEKIILKSKEVRDEAYSDIDIITAKAIFLSKKRYDSLLLTKTKYIKYEKPIYINRSLDDALGVLSNYSYEITEKKDSTTNNSRKIN